MNKYIKIALATLAASSIGAVTSLAALPAPSITSAGGTSTYTPYTASGASPGSQVDDVIQPFKNGVNTPSPDAPVDSQLQVAVNPQTQSIRYVRDNDNPTMITKAFRVKHDPYDFLADVRALVIGSRFYMGRVSALVFNNGARYILVTAEDYKFKENFKNGMSLGQIIKLMDQGKIGGSGNPSGIYWPKYRSARQLAHLMARLGLIMPNDPSELLYGNGAVDWLPDLNVLMWKGNISNQGRLEQWLKIYDRPLPQALITYKVYELNFQNDGAVGMNYQAWKNGPGQDLFSTAFQASKGWSSLTTATASGMNGIPIPGGSNVTRYVRFSPMWNTKYLDFLTVRGNAKVLTSGKIDVMNRVEGHINVITGMPVLQDGSALSNYAYKSEADLGSVTINNAASTGVSSTTNSAVGDYKITGYSKPNANGGAVTVPSGSYSIKITRFAGITGTDVDAYYMIYLYNTTGQIQTIKAYDVSIYELEQTIDAAGSNYTSSWVAQDPFTSSAADLMYKAPTTDTGTSTNSFDMTVYPVINSESTSMQIDATHTSLIGFKSDGTPRTQTSTIATRIQVPNHDQEFVIGGLNAATRVRNNDGIPFLCKLPIIGSLFSRETEEIKKNKILIVMQVKPLSPTYLTTIDGINGPTSKKYTAQTVNLDDVRSQLADTMTVTDAPVKSVRKSVDKIKNKGIDSMNKWGFGQWFIDPDATVPFIDNTNDTTSQAPSHLSSTQG